VRNALNVINVYGVLAVCLIGGGYLLYANTVDRWGWAFSVIVFLVVAGFAAAYDSGRSRGRLEGYAQAIRDARKRTRAIADPEEVEDFLALEAQREARGEGFKELEDPLRLDAHTKARGVRKADRRREADRRRLAARNRAGGDDKV
jgi:hypothetical protein